jgi:hypothetical protein
MSKTTNSVRTITGLALGLLGPESIRFVDHEMPGDSEMVQVDGRFYICVSSSCPARRGDRTIARMVAEFLIRTVAGRTTDKLITRDANALATKLLATLDAGALAPAA